LTAKGANLLSCACQLLQSISSEREKIIKQINLEYKNDSGLDPKTKEDYEDILEYQTNLTNVINDWYVNIANEHSLAHYTGGMSPGAKSPDLQSAGRHTRRRTTMKKKKKSRRIHSSIY
jgi:hypothetical protein